jgi:hypothetical protein
MCTGKRDRFVEKESQTLKERHSQIETGEERVAHRHRHWWRESGNEMQNGRNIQTRSVIYA